jgi:cyclopropane fatty-acyl-phospholipid synthase-like methyltransferase
MPVMLPFSASCERNKDPILEVLRIRFADRARVLEIGSGTGQHAVYFSRALRSLTWHPTEQLAYLSDLTERVKLEGPVNLRAPTLLDVRQALWPVRSVDAMFTANTLHIMSWSEVTAFYRGVGSVLSPRGVLCVYGPFRYDGRYTSDSNREFDRMLQDRDPNSGLRDIREVTALALQYGLRLDEDHDLPANNRLLVFAKEPG